MSLFEDTNPHILKGLLAEIQRVTGPAQATDLHLEESGAA
jgi:hypothetical protein